MATLQVYNYTNLALTLKIDPEYCTGTIYVSFSPASGIPVEITTQNYDAGTGEINVELTQAQSAGLNGIVAIQANGFKNSKRWATQKAYIQCDQNLIDRVLS